MCASVANTRFCRSGLPRKQYRRIWGVGGGLGYDWIGGIWGLAHPLSLPPFSCPSNPLLPPLTMSSHLTRPGGPFLALLEASQSVPASNPVAGLQIYANFRQKSGESGRRDREPAAGHRLTIISVSKHQKRGQISPRLMYVL